MNGEGLGVGRRPLTILVYEHVTGGGLVGEELPPSWAIEGAAMRRSIARDFAAVPGVRVVMTLDARLEREEIPGIEVRTIDSQQSGWFESLAAEADYTILIAPEMDGVLSSLTGIVERVGGRSLGSSVRAVEMVGDKARLAHHFSCRDIPSPPNLMISRSFEGFPDGWEGPIVIKPRHGVGSVDTVVVRDGRCPAWVPRDQSFVAQPYFPGRPMSASFLIDIAGGMTLLAIGRQGIEVEADGRICYRGGTVPEKLVECPSAVFSAIASVVEYLPRPSLRGFVGVDFLLDDRGAASILEINPRPTTSHVGLIHLLRPGTLAGAWLAAAEWPLAGTSWPNRLRIAPDAPAVSFDADGTILPRPGDELT